MSSNTTAHFIGGTERVAYTIEHRGECILITGGVPMAKFEAITKLAPEGSVMDTDAARVLGVTFAIGPAHELSELRAQGAAEAERQQRAMHPHLSQAAARWLANGERGVSSNTIFTKLTGVDALGGWSADRASHPHDPADFRRCQLLLEQVPELQILFPRMAHVSQQWKALVEAWPTIVAAMDEEAPEWRKFGSGKKAPKAYNLIKAAIGL